MRTTQNNRWSVPPGTYLAYADPKIRIPRSQILQTWEEVIRAHIPAEKVLPAEELEKCMQVCSTAIACALQELRGPQQYFTLRGYGDFESRLFRAKYWAGFQTRFPDIGPYLQNLARMVHSRLHLDFQPEIVVLVEDYLQKAGYPEWSPNFFKRHSDLQARGVGVWVRIHLKGYNGLPDWMLLVQRLSPAAQKGFARRPLARRIDRTKLIELLAAVLDRILEKEDFWTPSLLADHWSSLYEVLRQEFRTPALRPDRGDLSEQASRPNWPAVLLELSNAHRSRFRWAFGKELSYRREEDAVQEFIEILTQWQPPRWGPRWLEENGFWALRQYWENHFRTEKGHIDWPRLLRQLPTNLQEGFDPPDRSL